MVELGEPTAQCPTSAGVIRYRDVGQGPTLLFAHGLLFNGRLWRKVVPLLADRFRCVVPDLPLGGHRPAMDGRGDLRPPALAGLLLELAEATGGPVTLVGNDTGGALCQLAAARLVEDGRTELLTGLVLTNCDTFDNFLPRVFRSLQVAGYLPGGTRLIAESMRVRALWSTPLAYGLLQHSPVDAATVTSYFVPPRADRGVRHDTAKVLRSIRKRYTVAAAEALRHFDRPTLFAWGDDDRVFRIEDAERLAAQMPSATVERIEGSRALVPEDQPARLAELVAAFAGVPARPTGA